MEGMRSPHRSLGLLLVAPLLLPGCGEDEKGPPTYNDAVQPLLARHCVQCHTDGQIAPFALDGYDAAAKLAAGIAAAVEERRMPPYPVDNSGECNTFRDARWLTDEEIATFVAWSEAGAPAGEPRSPEPPASRPQLSGDIVTISTGADYTPNSAQADDYRCFLAEVPDVEDPYYITGFDVHPGEPRVVHHVIVYHPASDDAAANAKALDDAEEGPGYTCFGASGVTAGAVAAWAPGGGATFYPDGTGIKLRKGRPLILQVHYNTLAGEGLSDRTSVDLQVATGEITVGKFRALADLTLSLPPGMENAEAGITSKVPDSEPPFLLAGLFPHMHTLGKTLRIDLERADGSKACVVDVPRWDFHWQMLYFHETGMTISPGDTLSMSCTYDTRSRSTDTHWGEGTQDEMCIAGLFVVP